jgi:hypothetical protein
MRWLWLFILVFGCGKSADGPSGPNPVGKGPGRIKETVCPDQRPPGQVQPGIGGSCQTDAECTTGINGRCNGIQHLDVAAGLDVDDIA